MKLRKAKTVVVAPNIEQIESEGGLDDLLGSILRQAEDFGLPVVFALSRKKMGQVSLAASCCHLLCLFVCVCMRERLCTFSDLPLHASSELCTVPFPVILIGGGGQRPTWCYSSLPIASDAAQSSQCEGIMP